ncbi:unnamed protein product [Rhizopus stolonifer]
MLRRKSSFNSYKSNNTPAQHTITSSLNGRAIIDALKEPRKNAFGGLLGNKRASLGNLRQSKSSTTADQRESSTRQVELYRSLNMKRRSTGCLRRSSVVPTTSPTTTGTNNNKVWRSPGHYEIPNVFGSDCFLKPEPNLIPQKAILRTVNSEKHISKHPWRPAGPCSEIPQLPPLIRTGNKFERKIRKALPSSVLVSSLDPRNKYDGFQEIGTGVNGSVVRARHKCKKNVYLAIKRCRLDSDKEYKASIIRELFIMSTGHTNLIRLKEVSLWKHEVWMAMDLQKCSVFAVLCERGIPENYAVYITCETLKGLCYLHSKSFIHRDIKCENLLIGWNGEVKLADFGLATKSTKRNRDRLGTSKWMAPEVIREQFYDEKIDMWSLGITIIEMMDRVPPHYLIRDEKELFKTILRETNPTFTYSFPSMYMRGLVAWLLDEQPSTRPHAVDVLQEIEDHVQGKLLQRSTTAELARFVNHVLAK